MKSVCRLMLAAASCVAAMSVPTTSEAQQGPYVTGAQSACVQMDGAFGQIPQQDLFVGLDGLTVPTGSPNVILLCSTGRLTSNAPTNVFIDYADNTTSASVTCSAQVVSFSGASIFSSATSSSSSAGTGIGFFHIVIPANAIGYVSVTCHMPASSRLIGFNLQ